MLISLSLALSLLADAPAQGAEVPVAAPVSGSAANSSQSPAVPGNGQRPAVSNSECTQPKPDGREIVICAERPQGYRLNPDVMEAKREAHGAGRPVRPGGTVRPDCATVGPQPCVNAGINLLAAVATAAEMAQRLAKGQEVGSMFMTDPHPDEYHLYLMAKARREAEEAEKDALKKAKAPPARTPPPPAADLSATASPAH